MIPTHGILRLGPKNSNITRTCSRYCKLALHALHLKFSPIDLIAESRVDSPAVPQTVQQPP